MPDVILGLANPANFAAPSDRWPREGGVPVRFADDDGTGDAWRLPDGRIVGKAHRTWSPAKQAALEAAAAQSEATRVARNAKAANVRTTLSKTTLTAADVKALLTDIAALTGADKDG